jgi:hypothetical protein
MFSIAAASPGTRTTAITIVDILSRILLPSLQCFAHAHAEIKQYPYDGYSVDAAVAIPNAMQQSRQPFHALDVSNPHFTATSLYEQLLTPDSVGTILTIRLIFMCWACT